MNNENVYNCIIAKWSHEEEGEITTGGPRPRERCSAKSMQDHNRISQNKEAQTRRSSKRSPKRAIKKTRSQSNTRYHSTVHRLLYLQTVLFFSSLQSLLFILLLPPLKGWGGKKQLKSRAKVRQLLMLPPDSRHRHFSFSTPMNVSQEPISSSRRNELEQVQKSRQRLLHPNVLRSHHCFCQRQCTKHSRGALRRRKQGAKHCTTLKFGLLLLFSFLKHTLHDQNHHPKETG